MEEGMKMMAFNGKDYEKKHDSDLEKVPDSSDDEESLSSSATEAGELNAETLTMKKLTAMISLDEKKKNYVYDLEQFKSFFKKENKLKLFQDLIEKHKGGLLLHPVMRVYLYIYWSAYYPIFLLNLLTYLTFSILLTVYGGLYVALIKCGPILDDPNCFKTTDFGKICSANWDASEIQCEKLGWRNGNKNETLAISQLRAFMRGNEVDLQAFRSLDGMWYVVVFFIVFYFVLREAAQLYHTKPKWRYFRSLENQVELLVIILTCGFMISSEHNTEAAEHFGGWALFFAWMAFTFFVARVHQLGRNILMSFRVAKELVFSLIGFLPSLVAFGAAFHMLLSGHAVFRGITTAFLKILDMMVGELEFSDTFLHSKVDEFGGRNISVQIMFLIFLIYASVIIMNLLIALTINSTEDLSKAADEDFLKRRIDDAFDCIEGLKGFPKLGKLFNPIDQLEDQHYKFKINLKLDRENNPWQSNRFVRRLVLGEERAIKKSTDEILKARKEQENMDKTLKNDELSEQIKVMEEQLSGNFSKQIKLMEEQLKKLSDQLEKYLENEQA